MSGEYAKGSQAWGVCQRCGLRDLLNNLVFDEYYPGLRVHLDCKDYKHPQEKLIVVSDPIALWKPAPEAENTPSVLSGSQVTTTIHLSWTQAQFFTGIVEGYKVYKSVNQADFTLVATYPNTYSWDGELLTQTLSAIYSGVTPGQTLDYYVSAYDINNRTLQSNDLTIVTT